MNFLSSGWFLSPCIILAVPFISKSDVLSVIGSSSIEDVEDIDMLRSCRSCRRYRRFSLSEFLLELRTLSSEGNNGGPDHRPDHVNESLERESHSPSSLSEDVRERKLKYPGPESGDGC